MWAVKSFNWNLKINACFYNKPIFHHIIECTITKKKHFCYAKGVAVFDNLINTAEAIQKVPIFCDI